mmetsp:Transcript_30572/g.91645  ORF Transcript_30572/g.91645 Transcript_30572/m.91645 type:complete len:248 (+) Transcript_30572:321-1064(+)
MSSRKAQARMDAPAVPIIYGSRSKAINPGGPVDPEQARSSSESTHNWKVYVQCPCDKDLTKVIRKVVFKLHESFDNPNRTCSAPPYEVSESGWGEFEINIKIYFVDQKEKPISFFHLLKLYPVEGQPGAGATVEKDGELFFRILRRDCLPKRIRDDEHCCEQLCGVRFGGNCPWCLRLQGTRTGAARSNGSRRGETRPDDCTVQRQAAVPPGSRQQAQGCGRNVIPTRRSQAHVRSVVTAPSDFPWW